MGHGDDWRAALEHVKTIYVEPGKQPTLIRDLAIEAMEYLDAHDLVTVPPLCRESWRIAMMSPERQLVNPFFTGGETISVSLPDQHDVARGENDEHAGEQHPLLPRHGPPRADSGPPSSGIHDLAIQNVPPPVQHAILGRRLGSLLGAAPLGQRVRQVAREPGRHAVLADASLRGIIFSLGFHLEKMSPQECIDFLVNRIGHERDNATAEVRRSFTTSYGPLYQAAYLLGGLQLHALHREMVDSGKMTDRDFHDAILKENDIPIDMVRALLNGQSLTPDYTPSWRFYSKDKTAR